MRTREQAQTVADRRNRRKAKRWPLLALAGQLEQTTADDILNADTKFENRMREINERLETRARAFRAQVATLISSEELAALDVRRKMYPPSAEYSANFWRGQLALRGAPPQTAMTPESQGTPPDPAMGAGNHRHTGR